MKLRVACTSFLFFLNLSSVFAADPETERFMTFFKESCRGEKGWHAEYSMTAEEKKSEKSQKLSGKVDLLLLCPLYVRFSLSENNNVFEFISDSTQAWIIRQDKKQNFRKVEQYNSLSKRGLGTWIDLFSRALDLSRSSLTDFSSVFSVENVLVDDKKSRTFTILHRKKLDQIQIDFGSDLEPRFDTILFKQKNHSSQLKFEKQIKDEKSSDLKNYNFFAQPGDQISLILDKAG